jgi:hypothetical protein
MYCSGFQVLAAVVMKNSSSWHITLCSAVKVNRRYGETYRPIIYRSNHTDSLKGCSDGHR